MLNTTINLYKKAYTGLSKETWLLSFVILINRSGTMVLPFMSIYCTQKLGFSIGQTGVVISMFGAGSILGALISGRLVDKIGFYYVQFFALFIGGSLFFVVAELDSFVSLCIGVFFLSLCNESFRPANSTAIVHYSKEENRTRSYSLNRLAINLGFSVGGVLGGFLASKNYHLLFWVDGVTNMCAALLMLQLLPAVKHQQQQKHNEVQGLSPYKDGNFLFFLIFTILFAICFMQLFGMQSLFLKTVWHITEQQIGILMAINGLLIVAIEMVMIHKLEGKKNPLFFIRIGVLLIAFGFLCMNFFPALFISAIASMLLLTVGEMFAMPFMNTYWIVRTKANNRGRYAALYTAAWSIAQVAAPAMGSLIAQQASFAVLWWVIGAISIVIFILALVLQNNHKDVAAVA